MSDKNSFYKNGQVKVSQNPKLGLKKTSKMDEEYTIDDLVDDSKEDEDKEIKEEEN